ncbi:MAG: AMP nucleosidase [Chlamydiota bacterium]
MRETKEELRQYQIKYAKDSLERYSGSPIHKFGSYLIITNFTKYVDYFAEIRGLTIHEGSTFKVAHSPKEDVSVLYFTIGSPAAAFVVDCCAFLPFKAALHLGMCGGLRRRYQVGDYFVPIASIRGEGTSDFYFPSDVPAMANFLVQKAVTNVLEQTETNYHLGICHTTNKRIWEFNEHFKEKLKYSRVQAIDMESATLFSASYKYQLPMGALYLISDLPLKLGGIKTKEKASDVFKNFTADHIEKGVEIMHAVKEMLRNKVKGASRHPQEDM